MYVNPTLTAEEFKTVHNALCEMRSVQQALTGVISEHLTTKLHSAIKEFEKGLERAYKEDNKAFDRKAQHFSDVKEELGLGISDWSIYEVDNLSDRHPFEGADRVVYKNHWGEKTVQCSINGLTWAALWVAADACIRDSGDDHHTFIEQFTPSKDDPRTLILQTGS